METDIETKAIKAAQSDWTNQKSYDLVCGDLWAPGPTLNLESGFYRCIYNYWATEEDEVFCHYYNQEVQRLLTEHGTPIWAPITRLTSRHESLEFLKNGLAWKEYKYASIKERNMVNSNENTWPQTPIVWMRIESRSVLLVGGNINARCGRIDVLDCQAYCWMASYQYRKSHYPHLPWANDE